MATKGVSLPELHEAERNIRLLRALRTAAVQDPATAILLVPDFPEALPHLKRIDLPYEGRTVTVFATAYRMPAPQADALFVTLADSHGRPDAKLCFRFLRVLFEERDQPLLLGCQEVPSRMLTQAGHRVRSFVGPMPRVIAQVLS